MATIAVENGPTIAADDGRRLVLALEDGGADILHRCGGNARCTTCRVVVLEGDPGAMNEAEQERLARENELEPNTRLSCQVRVHGDLAVRVIHHFSTSGLSDPGPRPIEWAPEEA